MAKVTITDQHDWYRFILKFPTVKITDVYNRGGATIKMDPYNGAELRKVCEVLDYAFTSSRHVTNDGYNLKEMGEVVRISAEKAKTVEEFLELFSDRMEVEHGLSKTARYETTSRTATTATVKKEGKGWMVQARFANGDDFDLKINGSSLSTLMNPPLTGLADQVSTATFGMLGVLRDPQAVAERFKDDALRSISVEDWIDNIRASIAPAPRA